MKFRMMGATTPEISKRELENRALARRAAAEGMVLLENDGILPLAPGKVALYGAGARDTVKGGSGSGDVHERESVNIETGLRNAGFTICAPDWMDRVEQQNRDAVRQWQQQVEESIRGYGPVRTMAMFDRIHEQPKPQPVSLPVTEADLTDETDTAIYVIARQAGEGSDRRLEKGQYYLSDLEEDGIRLLSSHYRNLILVINSGGIIDLSILEKTHVSAVILYSQGGMEGGNALADLITGKVNFSGRLTDTWAYHYEDYPYADEYGSLNGDLSKDDYKEGTYVGYRWFGAKGIRPRYAFGYGLSYTTFSQELISTAVSGTQISCDVRVTNTGCVASKDVAMLYLRRPGDGARVLVAAGKTGQIAAGAEEQIRLFFDLSQWGLYCEEGSDFRLNAGEYGLYLGDRMSAVLTLDAAVITEKVERIVKCQLGFADYCPDGTGEMVYPDDLPRIMVEASAFTTQEHSSEIPKVKVSGDIRGMVKKLTDRELVSLCAGGGYNPLAQNRVPGACGNTSLQVTRKGIPNLVLADGPAGINVMPVSSVTKTGMPCYPEGLPQDWSWGWLKHLAPVLRGPKHGVTTYYHYMTAWPCETLLAQTWDTDLMEQIGDAVGREMEEVGVSVWLAPSVNIHRNPLCGRNFEYYSEDAWVSGTMAASLTRGVQSHPGCAVTIKHFCCNNREDDRIHMSSNLSEKTLREIYLRPFRIAVETATPKALMTSYNMVNGTYVANSCDLCTGVLRTEWGYSGVVMTDWNAADQCSYEEAVNAGNDIIMPGNNTVRKALLDGLHSGRLQRSCVMRSVGRVLNMIEHATGTIRTE